MLPSISSCCAVGARGCARVLPGPCGPQAPLGRLWRPSPGAGDSLALGHLDGHARPRRERWIVTMNFATVAILVAVIKLN